MSVSMISPKQLHDRVQAGEQVDLIDVASRRANRSWPLAAPM